MFEVLIGLFFVVALLLIDHRLNKILKELVLLNRGLAYLASLAPKESKPGKTAQR